MALHLTLHEGEIGALETAVEEWVNICEEYLKDDELDIATRTEAQVNLRYAQTLVEKVKLAILAE